MLATIRRHQKWLWFIIVAATIVSFVWFFSPQRRFGRATRAGSDVVGSMNGRAISRRQYLNALTEARIRYRLFSGAWPDEEQSSRPMFDQNQQVRSRLILLDLLGQLHIDVSDPAIADWIANVFRVSPESGFQMELYQRFIKALADKGISEEDFRQFVKHEVGVQLMANLFGASGQLITPQEAEEQFRQANEQVKAQAVFFYSSNYLGRVQVTPAAIATFYTNQQALYRIPERVQASYVEFPATNYFAQADQALNSRTNLSQLIDAAYAQEATNTYAGMTPQAAKAKIRETYRAQVALIDARKAANDFAEKLLELPTPTLAGFENLARSNHLAVKISPLFSQEELPPGLNVPADFTSAAFQLSPAAPFTTQPIVGPRAVYVLAFRQRIPSELPSLDSIRPRVVQDYRRSRAEELAGDAGTRFDQAVTNGLAHGDTFAQIARAANVPLTQLPLFSQQTRRLEQPLPASLGVLRSIAFSLAAGHASDFVPTRSGGFVLFLQARVPVSAEVVNRELPDFIIQLRRSQESEAFENWFRHEAGRVNLQLAGERRAGQ